MGWCLRLGSEWPLLLSSQQKEDDDLAETDRLKRDMQFRRINLRLRASTQTFNDEERIKYNIQGVDPLDWTKETRCESDAAFFTA